MKKEDFLTLGVEASLAEKCAAAVRAERDGLVPKVQLDELRAENEALKASVSDRDKQLEALKKSTGDADALKQQIDVLQKQNDEQEKAHKAEIARLRLDSALDAALTAAGARNGRAVRALLDTDKVTLGEDGTLSGLDEQLAALKKSDGYLFAEKEAPKAPQFRGLQPGASGDAKPDAAPDINSMTYSQFMAAQVSDYKQEVRQAMLLAILAGVFGMKTAGMDAAAKEFIDKHTFSLSLIRGSISTPHAGPLLFIRL